MGLLPETTEYSKNDTIDYTYASVYTVCPTQ